MMYVRFPLSLRNVEDLLHERGIQVSHETIRFWWNRFGPIFAAEIRGGPHRLDHLAAFLRWTPQFLLPPVREILRGGEPEGKVPLRMFFQASVHLLRRRPSVRRVRSLAVV